MAGEFCYMDIRNLIRRRLYDLNLQAAEASRKIFSQGNHLNGLLNGDKVITPAALARLWKHLGNRDQKVARAWIGAFLLDRGPPEMAALVAAAGLDKPLPDTISTSQPRESNAWRRFSSKIGAGMLRERMLQYLSHQVDPVPTHQLAKFCGISQSRAMSNLKALAGRGLLDTHCEHAKTPGSWNNTTKTRFWELTAKGHRAISERAS
jgi:hypothetical protein